MYFNTLDTTGAVSDDLTTAQLRSGGPKMDFLLPQGQSTRGQLQVCGIVIVVCL